MKYVIKKRNSDQTYYIDSSKSLDFFYGNIFGRIILKIIINRLFSKLCGLYLSTKISTIGINKFIEKYNIDMSDYEKRKYVSFNDFFTRKIIDNKREIDNSDSSFISPCDSNLTVYNINKDLTLKIKDSYYSIDTLVDKSIVENYIDGLALVFRLDVSNYHRYVFIDSGTKDKDVLIKGVLHTVQPIALDKYNFYKTNSRMYTILHTNNFKDVVEVEVGAMCIGKITNHDIVNFKKGQEKGYFEYGGSTIVLLVKKDTIKIDDDILDNSKNDIETMVKCGEKIGTGLQ